MSGRMFGSDNPSSRPEVREKISQAKKGRSLSEMGHKEGCQCCICKSKRGETGGIPKSPEHRRRIGGAKTGVPRPDMVENNPSKRPEVKEMRKIQVSGSRNPSKRLEVRNKKAVSMRRRWQDPSYVAKQMAARQVSQNKAEILLQSILDEHFPNQWKFVGGGQLVVSGKCPDFVHTERKLLIELFGDYWHDESEVEPRIQLFEAEGYQTLVIWEHQLEDIASTVDAVQKFEGYDLSEELSSE